jgi:hypothetical protein
MTIEQIINWLKHQSPETLSEFKDGVEHYRWGEDIPSVGQFSTAFELGWRYARLQHSS